MNSSYFRIILLMALLTASIAPSLSATKSATVRSDSNVKYQKITGFGGFVCSGQFAYNHMTTAEIQKIWGNGSQAGYNIMRLYIPDESTWSQTLATAQLAKSLGLIVFASPWSMPASWKTNNNIAAIYNDTLGYLKEEYYDDYASYLNRYVTYLKDNGVELDAISIQNEPDMQATYAGCMWTPAQIANFLKYNAKDIQCNVMAPESVGISDNYVNACLDDSVSDEIDIYAGHQYGNIQDGMKNMQAKGKDVWMTEYLINWNEDEDTTRNFVWTKDGFNFATKLNDAMLANVNAWIHYASKRYYGLIGDGTYGSTTGTITKRGYILAHFAKNTIGSTRIGTTWKDDSNVLEGSSYLSVSGDSVVVMVINPSANSYDLTLDLPFYTTSGKNIVTATSQNMTSSVLSIPVETCRPKTTIKAYSVNTFIFIKSSERPASQMTGTAVHTNTVESLSVTSTGFGTAYKLSGKTATFDNSRYLISANKTASNGYLKLNDRYNKLVFHVNTISSTMNYTSANTTLYYINANGAVSSYNYGTVSFDNNGNFDWVLDISRGILTDGCTGILGISNSNYSSVLTIGFGDVFLLMGNEKMHRFTGIYSKEDSDLLDCLEDSSYVSLDFTGTTGITSELDWFSLAVSKNGLYYTAAEVVNVHNNVVTGSSCNLLDLSSDGGNFYAPVAFTATQATFTCTLNGRRLLTLPFAATLPSGVKAYSLQMSGSVMACTALADGCTLPANTPVLVEGTGSFTFLGEGTVVTPRNFVTNALSGVYIATKALAGSFILTAATDSVLHKVTVGSEPVIGSFSAYCTPETNVSASTITLNFLPTGLRPMASDPTQNRNEVYYDIQGRRVTSPERGFYVCKGKKLLIK
jgi:glucuronoarabinoxylan endo-1,4-beta-xylanase